jgi:transposase
MPQTARVRVARDELRRIRELTRAERALERELTAAIRALHPRLLAEQGVGAIIAATLIGRTAGARRFPTDGHYARQAGVAPIPVASGRHDRVRLNRGGDRQLNHALHTIAITRARTCPKTRAYLDRKLAQGKTRPEAYRCLKRHLARRIWRLLHDLPDQPQPRPQSAMTIHCNMPTHALALT